jgi:hypothetical protein
MTAIAAGCAGESPVLPLSDDFSGKCLWPESSSNSDSTGCSGGEYVLKVEKPGHEERARSLGVDLDALRVEVDAVIRSGATGTGYGVGCWTGEDTTEDGRPDGLGYVFFVTPDGGWVIARDPVGPGLPQALAVRNPPGAIELNEGTNRIGADCVRDAGGVTLVLRLKGAAVAVASDNQAGEPFTSIGFFAGTDDAGAEVVFDNAAARKLSGAEARAAAARPTTPDQGIVRLPLEDDFDLTCDWPFRQTDELSADCTGDQYRVSLEKPRSQYIAVGLDHAVDSLRFEVDATLASGTPAYGVACWSGSDDHTQPPDGPGYWFVTAADEGWALWRDVRRGRDPQLMLVGLPGSVQHREGANTIGGDCVNRDGKTTLVLRIDGEVVAVARRPGDSPFGWIGFVANGPAGTDVRFDDARARELSDEEARTEAGMEVTPTPTGDPIADAQLRQLGIEIPND